MDTLTQAYKNTKNVPRYVFGKGAVLQLKELVEQRPENVGDCVVYCIDMFFEGRSLINQLPIHPRDEVIYYDSTREPLTSDINRFVQQVRNKSAKLPNCVVGIGGGSTLDVAKAVANMLTNPGRAEDYQGWDLVTQPAVYKIGVPTLSGTGAEVSRTCVLMNIDKEVKLGMNSDHTMFDQLILDPDLTRTAPRDQYFYTGMDTYFHCMESVRGSYRNVIVDALSEKAMDLCKDVFLSDDMMSDENREKLMIASYLGGMAAGNTGVLHPLSAGLSVALHTPHCLANCCVMNVMEEFYPSEYHDFQQMLSKQNIQLPVGLCADLSEDTYEKLYRSSIVHEKPLMNALGEDFRNILTKERLIALYKRM